jgi:hypothetical protein
MKKRYIIRKEHKQSFIEGFATEDGKPYNGQSPKKLFASRLEARIWLNQNCEDDLEYYYMIQEVFIAE